MLIGNRVEILLPCSREELRRRLEARMDRGVPGVNAVIGHVRADRLWARRRIRYRNSFQTCLSARLIEREGETLVRCRFSLHPAVLGFIAFWFAGALAGGGLIFHAVFWPAPGAADSPAKLWGGLAIAAVMMVCGIAVVTLGRQFARDEQAFLIDFIRQAAMRQRPAARAARHREHQAPAPLAGGAKRRLIAEGPVPMLLICAALFVFWGFGYETVGLRLGIALDGIVVARQEIPRSPATHGTGMRYVVRDRNGANHTYVAGANDGSLPRTIPLGAHIVKRRWQLSYLLNGRRIDDFPIVFYAVILTAGLLALIWGVLQLFRRSA